LILPFQKFKSSDSPPENLGSSRQDAGLTNQRAKVTAHPSFICELDQLQTSEETATFPYADVKDISSTRDRQLTRVVQAAQGLVSDHGNTGLLSHPAHSGEITRWHRLLDRLDIESPHLSEHSDRAVRGPGSVCIEPQRMVWAESVLHYCQAAKVIGQTYFYLDVTLPIKAKQHAVFLQSGSMHAKVDDNTRLQIGAHNRP
jgi:hypothetical protein